MIKNLDLNNGAPLFKYSFVNYTLAVYTFILYVHFLYVGMWTPANIPSRRSD
jgi:hypothetical protein